MATCDLCGGGCKASEMVQLREQYRIDGVEDICPECGKWANKIKDEITAEIAPRMRDAILAKKGEPPAPAPTKWWRILLAHNAEFRRAE